MSSVFGLGLFQLESIIQARPNYCFFDIRLRPQILGIPAVQAVLDQARVSRPEVLMTSLLQQKTGKDDPIILLCEDGRLSIATADQLGREGFTQVYIVDGGLDGLLREASIG